MYWEPPIYSLVLCIENLLSNPWYSILTHSYILLVLYINSLLSTPGIVYWLPPIYFWYSILTLSYLLLVLYIDSLLSTPSIVYWLPPIYSWYCEGIWFWYIDDISWRAREEWYPAVFAWFGMPIFNRLGSGQNYTNLGDKWDLETLSFIFQNFSNFQYLISSQTWCIIRVSIYI